MISDLITCRPREEAKSYELPTGRLDREGKPSRQPRRVASDVDGAFAIALPERGAEAKARVSHGQYIPQPVSLPTDPVLAPEIRMLRRGSLRGTILDKAGSPVPGAPLLISVPGYGEEASRRPDSVRMQADAAGRFEVPNLLDGRVIVFVLRKPRDADENALTSSSFKMTPGESCDVVVRIDRPERCHVTGEISGPKGRLSQYVPVFLPYAEEGGWTMAKAGKYGFDAGGVERGRYLVALVPTEDSGQDGPVALIPDVEVTGLGAQRFIFTFPSSSLRGTIAGGKGSSTPPVKLRLLAVPAGLTGFAAEFFRSAKAARSFGAPVVEVDGAFRMEHLSRGAHRLELWSTESSARAPLAFQNVEVAGSLRLGEWVWEAEPAAGR